MTGGLIHLSVLRYPPGLCVPSGSGLSGRITNLGGIRDRAQEPDRNKGNCVSGSLDAFISLRKVV